MAEPFKNLFNATVVDTMAGHLARVEPSFDKAGFVTFVMNDFDALELKERSTRITDGLEHHLPNTFPEAVNVLLTSLDPKTNLPVDALDNTAAEYGIRGWAVMPMADYVARHGQDHVDISLAALRDMTSRFSSEFAIRPFLQNHTQTTLKAMQEWATDKNEHVRRLVSEGSRPRLPWGIRLHTFVAEPAPVVKLLEHLKDDPSEYVRRSVANNLNDIAKDHPDLVADIANDWMKGASKNRTRLVRHALRTLIKDGHPEALRALGYGPADVTLTHFDILTPHVELGGAVEFALEIASPTAKDQPLIIDYAVHHMRANGKMTAKVFKWKTFTLKGNGTFCGTRRHAFKPITTRRYYSGQHRIDILLNGKTLAGATFDLQVD